MGYGWITCLLELAGFMPGSTRTHLAFSYTVFTQLGSSTVYVGVVLISLVQRVVPCVNPNLQRGGNGAVS